MEPGIIPLLFISVYLELVRASESVMSPNHSAKCLSSDTLSGLLLVHWSHLTAIIKDFIWMKVSEAYRSIFLSLTSCFTSRYVGCRQHYSLFPSP